MAIGNYYALLPSGELVCDSFNQINNFFFFTLMIQETLSFSASK